MNTNHLLLTLCLICLSPRGLGEIKAQELPHPLLLENGKEVTTSHAWEKERRPEILQLYREHVYGSLPEDRFIDHRERIITDTIYNNRAYLKEVTLIFDESSPCRQFSFSMILPASAEKAPVIMGLNFSGTDKVITPANDRKWNEYPIREFIDRGYGLVTCHYQDIMPDGPQPVSLYNERTNLPHPAGAISIWAWGIQRMMDYISTEKRGIDNERVVLYGFSRLGKAALWAGATDERFAMVILNASGCGGAGLFNHPTYESIEQVTRRFPYWFTEKFKEYSNREEFLPVDQHLLIASIAPRPVCIGNGEKDPYVEPMGEFRALKGAEIVYGLYGLQGVPVEKPEIEVPYRSSCMGYHIRKGGHDIMDFDWKCYLEFIDILLISTQFTHW